MLEKPSHSGRWSESTMSRSVRGYYHSHVLLFSNVSLTWILIWIFLRVCLVSIQNWIRTYSFDSKLTLVNHDWLWQPCQSSLQQKPGPWRLLSLPFHGSLADHASCLSHCLFWLDPDSEGRSVALVAFQVPMSKRQIPREGSSCDWDVIVFAQRELPLISENPWTSTQELTVISPLMFWLFVWHSRNDSYQLHRGLVIDWKLRERKKKN